MTSAAPVVPTRPVLPCAPSFGPGGVLLYLCTRVKCAICEGATDFHSSKQPDGSLSPDPWQLAVYLGYFCLPDGRVVCSSTCRKQAEHPASRFSLDASRHPADPRLNRGDQQQPVERQLRLACAGCGHVHNVVQRRQPLTAQTRDPRDVGKFTEWGPDPSATLTALGWLAEGPAWYCGRGCHERAKRPATPPMRAVATHPDVTVHRAAEARTAARRVAAPVNPMLVAQEGPEPTPPPKPQPARRATR